MQIRILGNGGAINDGLPYNSFMVDDYFLAETPPDIMTSLFREKINLSKIRIIYISHFHGDHYFGMPFLALRLFNDLLGQASPEKIKILGPHGIDGKIKEIIRLALGERHPANKWVEDSFIFVEFTTGSTVVLDNGISLKIFSMYHLIETYGFALYRNYLIAFCYFADTLWRDELVSQIKLFPEVILTDLCGELSDIVRVHMSEDDLVKNAMPHSEGRIMFYGTHLKTQKKTDHKEIRYVHPGDIITLK